MSAQTEPRPTADGEATTDFEAIVIGTGFAGLRSLYELRDRLGLSVRVFEAGTDVGGTWYWNRYPGARTDTESWAYCFAFDDELLQDWNWSERFPPQPEVQRYLRHVTERFDMRKDIQFHTRVESAIYDEEANVWTISTSDGKSYTCTYLVSGSGLLSVTYEPPFPGVDSFEGDWYQTSRWPQEDPDFAGKRVAVVGAGATAVQVIPEVADMAEHLTVFQRTPNYVMPSRNHPLRDAQRDAIKRDYDAIWEQAHKQVFAFPMDPANRVVGDVSSPEHHRQILEAGWEAGGFRYLFETFDDLLVDQESNDAASEFVRDKIRAIVHDPETAELLCPKDYPVGGKRPPLGHFYYETFNKPNVELISVKDNPIAEITPKGIRMNDGVEHEFDIIIFAVGFDAVTGALTHMDVRGKDGQTIKDRWGTRPQARLGLMVDGFPNMFAILGPQGPFANLPPVIEKEVEWISSAISTLRENGQDRIEPTPEAVREWDEHCQMLVDATILQKHSVGSWYLGTNIPGKPPSVLFYFGGAGGFFGELEKSVENGFEGFKLDAAGPVAAAPLDSGARGTRCGRASRPAPPPAGPSRGGPA